MPADMNQNQNQPTDAPEDMKENEMKASEWSSTESSGTLPDLEGADEQDSASADIKLWDEELKQRVSELIEALQNREDTAPIDLYTAILDAQEALAEWQKESVSLPPGKETSESQWSSREPGKCGRSRFGVS